VFRPTLLGLPVRAITLSRLASPRSSGPGWHEAGAPSVLLEIPWAEHAFDALPNVLSHRLRCITPSAFLACAPVGDLSTAAKRLDTDRE